MNKFTHLHLHTQYSLLDGAILVPKLTEHLKEIGQEACAITEHGWMPSVVDFYKTMKAAELKPILGVEAYITDDRDNLPQEHRNRDNHHMILIAKDNIGYERLLELVSNASMNNFYYKPRIYMDHLRQLGGHVVATTACLAGVLSRRLVFKTDAMGKAIACDDETGEAKLYIEYFQKVFGDDLYLEVQVWNDGTNYQPIYNEYVKKLSTQTHIPLVLTADCHYIKEEDYRLHELLMAMQMKMTLEEYRASQDMQYGPYFYVASSEEMMKRAISLGSPEAYYNTQKIVNKCDVTIQLGKYRMPVYDIKTSPDYINFLEWKEKL